MALRRPLIAIVDDEESVRRALSRTLRASRFDVVDFASGQEFLESIALRVPDCLILDFQMPGLTGRDVQQRLTAAKVRLPIIVVTAHDQPAVREQCLADGAVAYLAKPLRREHLIAVIMSALAEHQAH
ncbi:MAG TPA: response regulator [Steroidobacteraceae bacterium]|jgi:FixJ family two-component response regulator